MTTKRVFVRLAAVGGKQVKADLEGIGEAGNRGLGRLSREVDLANAKLSGFTRKAGPAAGAIASAMVAAGAAITTATMRSANEIAALAQVANTTPQALQRWAAGAKTVGIEQEKLADILKDVNDRVGEFIQTGGGPMKDFFANIAPRVGVTADQFARLSGPEALQLYVRSLEKAGASQQDMTFYMEAMASDSTLLLPLLRNNGAAMQALGDRAAGLGAVLDQKAIAAMRRTQAALVGVEQVFEGMRNQIATALAPSIEALANAFVAAASTGGVINRALSLVLGNLERLAAYAGSFAVFMAGRWVAGLAAAALSVKGLATAFVVLRAALIRTGIGALIVGAGELAYQFSKLAEGAGGFGAALALLKDAGFEAWNRISLAASAAWSRVEAGWAAAQAVIYDGLQGATVAVVDWGNSAVGTFQGTYDAVKAIWKALPQAIGDFAYQAANGLIDGVESMLNAVVTRINSFIEGLNAALALLPEWATGEGGIRIGSLQEVNLGGITNPFQGAATEAGAAAGKAFSDAMGKTYVDAPNLFGGMAADARSRSGAYDEAAGMLSDAASRPMTAWEALKAAITGAGASGEDALTQASDAAANLANGLNTAGTAAKGAGAKTKAAAEEAKTGWAAVAQTLAEYSKEAMNWGKGLGSTLVDAFSSAESAFRQFVTTGKFDFKSLVSSMLADLAVLSFKRAVLGPIASALSLFMGPAPGSTASILHAGGMVGIGGGPSRAVSALAFAGAPKMHSGGWAGLRPDEVPAILQRGERVLSRREVAQGGSNNAASGVNISIDARGAQMGVAEQIDTKLRAAIPQIERIAKQAVADGRRRGHAL
jgi:hypothetical protein